METPIDRNAERLATMRKNVVVNADSQATTECRENFLQSCEAHGGELAQVVAEYRLAHA